jgi:hypothetical protein
MKKSGLSQIVATLLIILLSLIVISFVWVVVSKLISDQSSIAEVQNRFFSQDVNFAKVQLDPEDGLKLNTSIRTSSGSFKGYTENITAPASEIDVISVSDLSGSMRDCQGISDHCCTSHLHGSYQDSHCYSLPSAYVNQCVSNCGGTLIDGINSSQNANKQLVDTIFQRPDDNNRIGLVAYNTTVINLFSSNLINNNLTLKTIINSWGARGGTCICCGLNNAKNRFSDSSADRAKTIIVMSDGEATVTCNQQGTGDAKDDAIQAACEAYSEIPGLTIYSVGLGGNVDNDTLDAIAQCGNGEYFSASQVNDLMGIYQTLAEQIIQKSSAFKELNYLKIIFYDGAGHSVILHADVPEPLQTKYYQFDLNGQGLVAPIVKMEIYPVASTAQGKEVVGPLFDFWEKK